MQVSSSTKWLVLGFDRARMSTTNVHKVVEDGVDQLKIEVGANRVRWDTFIARHPLADISGV